MIWRYLLAFVLSLGVLILYQVYVVGRRPVPEEARPLAPIGNGGAGEDPRAPKPMAPGKTEVTPEEGPPQEVSDRPQREDMTFVLKTAERVEAVAHSKGGQLSAIRLPEYSETVELRTEGVPYQLTFPLRDRGGILELQVGGYDLPATEHWELQPSPEGGVILSNELRGLRIRKIVNPGLVSGWGAGVDPDAGAPYAFRVEIELENTTDEPISDLRYRLYGPSGIDTESGRQEGIDLQLHYGFWAQNEVVSVTLSASGLKSDTWYRDDNPAWVAVTNNYFTSILIPGTPQTPRPVDQIDMAFAESYPDWEVIRTLADAQSLTLEALPAQTLVELQGEAYKNVRVGLRSSPIDLEPGGKVTHSYVLFAGPRESDLLATYEEINARGVNHYGWVGGLIKFFMWMLDVLCTICFGSYGVAIVVLTLIVKICLHPINRRSQKSMQRFQKQMQRVKPEMDELKERYGDNRMKLNAEMQKLWKEHGINPGQQMGGCLVLFLQLPVWWALYNTLQYAIGLRQAGFLYIDDLTRPDQLLSMGLGAFGGYFEFFNLFPVLYVILTLVNQKLQPKPADPQMRSQMRMMSFMMVGFGFIFYNFPSGFMLYIMTSSALGIIESKVIKAELAREELAAGSAKAAGSAPQAPGSGGGSLYPAKTKKGGAEGGRSGTKSKPKKR